MHHLQQQVFSLVVVVVVVVVLISEATATGAMAKPGCQDRCGNITIPYPFGIGSKNCYLGKYFEVTCNHSTYPPVLHQYRSQEPDEFIGFQIVQLTQEYVRLLMPSYVTCYKNTTGESQWTNLFIFEEYLKPFTYSTTRNKFIAIGCDIFAYIPSININVSRISYLTGCVSFCDNETFAKRNKIIRSCSGNGCCETSIPKGLNTFYVKMHSINTDRRSWESHPCSHVFIVENGYYYGFDSLLHTTANDPGDFDSDSFDRLFRRTIDGSNIPVVMDWAIGNKTCREAQKHVCGFNSSCVDSKNGLGYKCRCFTGFHGNPYLLHGCQDIDECKEFHGSDCPRNTRCENTLGDYSCVCPPEYHSYGSKSRTRCKHIKTKLSVGVVVPICASSGLVLVLLLGSSFWLHRRLGERKQTILKQMYFKKNGGLLMKQKNSSQDVGVEKTKLFVVEELQKATDNFNHSRILGKGGFGIVYKGMLSDGRIVAIKKSMLENERQVDQFINEVFILSQINHRHIVRLLGCCLETQVPLLVYEYISGGTLSQHLHSEGYASSMSWKDRLKIGSEIAGALAYLHSDASVPIFHRDMKSSNILLDECCRAKVSDFGLSRSVPIEKTHLTTFVQGTFGYLDPEYFHSRQLTDKSDVYSFGVILVELITGERAVSLVRPEDEKSLVMHFISALKEERLFDILDPRVVNEVDQDEVMIVAKIAERCLKLNGKKRPVMKEVAASLERLRKFQEQPWVEANKLQLEDFLVGETSSPCTTGTIFEPGDCNTSSFVSA